jgi:ribosomal protein L39E
MVRPITQKKVKLGVATRRTKWAPFWVVLRKFGVGKKTHPSSVTAHRRHWRRTKLKFKPRRTPKTHMG